MLNEQEKKENARGTLKLIIISIIAIILVGFGVKKGYDAWWDDKKANDESYKVITSRDKSYNGVYSLTKLDEKGNNTWDGLMMYVKDDKIINCSLIDRMTLDEFKKKYPHTKEAKTLEVAYDTAFDDFSNDYEEKWEDRYYKTNENNDYPQGGIMSGPDILKNGINGTINVCSYYNTKVNLDTDYKFLDEMKMIPGYDEKSGEIWLSKLLKNEQSEYHKGYKLRKYKNASDIDKNCKITDDSTMYALNKTYNAGLSEE